jgi:hypothetical protein
MKLGYINNQFVRHCLYAGYSFRRMYSSVFLNIALHFARQTHDTVFGGHADLRRVDAWFVLQFLTAIFLLSNRGAEFFRRGKYGE